MTDMDRILRDPLSRREFLTRMAAAGLGASAVSLLIAGCGGGGGSNSTFTGNGGGANPSSDPFPGIPANANPNIRVLNYAYTLEVTEADIYRQALNVASGKDINTPFPTGPTYDTSGYSLSPSISTAGVNNPAVAFLYLQQYSAIEATHRDFLAGVLGGSAVNLSQQKFKVNLAPANSPAGTAPTLLSIMSLIGTVEETGVTAYLGAVPYITDLGIGQTAASIYTTEARHSAAVNYNLNRDTGPQGYAGGTQYPVVSGALSNEFEYQQTPAAVLSTVKGLFFV